MKILFTGGVTGGHFYPIIAIAKEVNKVAKEEHALPPELYFMAPGPYDSRVLFENNITFVRAPAGKIRRYFSIANFFDLFKTAFGVIRAVFSVFSIYPDVIFGKGGHGSFPALLAGRIFRIPVIIHESDSAPGRVNSWAGKFAERIAVSYPEAASYFPKDKAVWTGHPIREEIMQPIKEGAREFLKLEPLAPVILILGGSQGAEAVNNAVVDALPKLLNNYQIIHQTGEKNFKSVVETASVVLENHPHLSRYKPFSYLNELAMRMSSGLASLVVTRAGSTIFEVASWGTPAIVIPIGEEVSHDQTKNAFSYARSGAGIVIEEKNLTSHILEFQIDKLMQNKEELEKMSLAAKAFAKQDAAHKIAKVIFGIAMTHEA
ncbi:MAG: UDP-N-acetylglucosamine--N-acetylmuramyl-(pentapeptide) pyrophosphoryl-undecaprenol N-acetylglucosamine transferase [bacterium]|nr:UDP-N-acetylglucosamine--N-acetylmuramyl-(pentapeptide) pyrophosphoryl-undecaprenol N-acetylglucosamine transferase [bacterium]